MIGIILLGAALGIPFGYFLLIWFGKVANKVNKWQ